MAERRGPWVDAIEAALPFAAVHAAYTEAIGFRAIGRPTGKGARRWRRHEERRRGISGSAGHVRGRSARVLGRRRIQRKRKRRVGRRWSSGKSFPSVPKPPTTRDTASSANGRGASAPMRRRRSPPCDVCGSARYRRPLFEAESTPWGRKRDDRAGYDCRGSAADQPRQIQPHEIAVLVT
ncbi:hypothetical protein DFJ74DRAFT_407983 [Hyaloraphidium curvatum]|nr:hypothetical protein DFJ74DRAFT_407983 [Hyaloraphidium curvatum]